MIKDFNKTMLGKVYKLKSAREFRQYCIDNCKSSETAKDTSGWEVKVIETYSFKNGMVAKVEIVDERIVGRSIGRKSE